MVSSRQVGALALALVLSFLVAANASPRQSPVAVANGTVAVAKTPLRIVSLSPTATEVLYAIGAGKQVVAVDDQSNYPARAPRTKLSGYTPNVEAIAGYEPDLVIGELVVGKVAGSLRKLGIPVLVQPTAKTLADAYAQIAQLGRVTGHRLQATRLVAKMKTQIAAIVKSVPRPSQRLAVYHELDPTYYSATSKTFIGRIYTLLGLTNIADAADKTRSGYPQLSAEYILAADPDLIVLADTKCCGQTAAKVADRAGWSAIAAVQKRDIVEASDDVASRWGPRVVAFMRLVAAKARVAAAHA